MNSHLKYNSEFTALSPKHLLNIVKIYKEEIKTRILKMFKRIKPNA
jgi:hypothetical protein